MWQVGRWLGDLFCFFAFLLVHFLFSANNNSSIHVLSIASQFRRDFGMYRIHTGIWFYLALLEWSWVEWTSS